MKTPTVATLFNTAAADEVLATMQVCPRNSAWNERIDGLPTLGNSGPMIAMIRSELAADRRDLRAFFEMNFVLVPASQALVPITFTTYPEESDPGPYPIPVNQPIELWPVNTEGQTLDQWQRDALGWGGDRHGLIVMPATGDLYETWQMKKLSNGAWQASNGARFNLGSNALRPLGWTSGDAAGLAMFPALVRWDEVQRGSIEHALRIVVRHTRREYIYPATHFASNPSTTDPNVPAMGQRLRLKASFQIPATWSPESKCVAVALKRYGALVADNGNFFQISVTPDDRWAEGCFDDVREIDVNDFEVVQTTGQGEGPRSPNPPIANAGPDRTAAVGTPISIDGLVSGGAGTVTVQWSRYDGPGTVTFGSATQPDTTANFSMAGTYRLMLKAADGIHTPAFDAVIVTVSAAGALSSFSFSPNPVDGGYATGCSIGLASPAPAGGARVWLSDTVPALLSPISVLIPPGQTQATLVVPSAAVTSTVSGTASATYGGFQRTTAVTVQPGPTLIGLTLAPSTVVGGAGATATATLSRGAPWGGAVLKATSSTSAMTASNGSVPAGASSGVVTVWSKPVASKRLANLTISIPGSSRVATLVILPPDLALISVAPGSIVSGGSAVASVRLNGKAPEGGIVVALRTSSPHVSLPPSATVPAGVGQVAVTVGTSVVTQTQVATLVAERLGIVRSTTLTITP